MLASSLARRFNPGHVSSSLLRQGGHRLQSILPILSFSAHTNLLYPSNRPSLTQFNTSGSTRYLSQQPSALRTSYRGNENNDRGQNRHQRNNRNNRSRNNNPNSIEKEVRQTTKRILSLGEEAQNSAANASNVLITSVRDKYFWAEADQAIKWWVKRGTAESVNQSFQLLDSLADLSMTAQEPQLSSNLLNTKILNQLVQNWLVALARDEKTPLAPTDMFAKLEEYRSNSLNTSRTRRKLRPDLETYQLLMEAAAVRWNSQTPAGYNESIVRHLMEQGKDSPELKPDIKTVAHILHGWSARGQVVPLEELKGVLSLLQGFIVAEEKPESKETQFDAQNKDTGATEATTVELFNKALFAIARSNSSKTDARGAEKMLSILNFMEFMASAMVADEDINLRPTVDTYNLVLNAFARAGKGAQAEMILRSWVDRYAEAAQGESSVNKIARPESKGFTIVITAFSNSEENYAAEKAEGVLRWQHEANREGVLQGLIAPETITYNNVIRAWSWRRSDKGIDMCDNLRKEMIENKVPPDLQTYGQTLKAISLSNLPEKGQRAVQVWREMQFCGVKADDYARKHFEKCVAASAQEPRRSRYRKQGRPARTNAQ